MMGFWVVALGLAAIWILLVMPAFGLVCLALSLLFQHLHRRHARSACEGSVRRWRRVLAIIFGILAGLNLLGGAAGWIFVLVTGG